MKKLLSIVLSCIIMLTCFSGISFVKANAVHSKVESAVQWALNIANDNSHGYSQLASRRWGNPDYDCSSLVITAFKNAGFNVGSATYTGNMRSVFVNAGFTWIPKSQINLSNSSQLQRGDILLNESTHVEIYIGNNQRVGAHTGYIDIYDTNYPGDNTGNEISIYNYSNSSNWGGVLRYNVSETPPTNVSLTRNQNWYDIQDTITLYPNSNGASSYWLSVYKGDAHIVDTAITGEYSFSASTWGQGDYYAWITATNSAGSTDSQGINFSVVGAPGYSNIYTSNWWYDLTDTVSITVDTVCAKGQVIGIDRNGTGRVITEVCDSTFTIPASQLGVGEYYAYFSVYNGSGGIDTEGVTFEIVDKPKDGAVVTSSKSSYTLNDTVEVSVLAYCSKGQVIGIDRIGDERVITETCDTTYSIPASQLGRGKYSAYFSVFNGSGGYDTERVKFAIDNPLSNPQIFANKDSYNVNEQIYISALVDGGATSYQLSIYNSNDEAIKEEQSSSGDFIIDSSALGVGTYSAVVECENYAFKVDTNKVNIQIISESEKEPTECSWDDGVITKNPTCETTGTKLYTCVDCGKTKTETVSAKGHSYTSTTIAPTCIKQGYTLKECKNCDYSYKTDYVSALGHTEIVTKGYEATCTKDGLTDSVNCSVCNEVLTEQEVIPAKGHKADDEWTTISSTSCTGEGIQVKYCLECGDIVEIKEVNSKGHTVVIDEAVDATCTNSGLTEGSHCSVCNLTIVVQQVVAPKGHQWDDGYISKSATCTTMGERTHTCGNCGEIKLSTISVLGHDFDDKYTYDTEATCTADGSKSKHCSNCDAKSEVTVIKATGHTHTSEVTTPATCTTEGVTTYTCHCGDSYTETIAKTAHNTVTDSKKVTYFEVGYENKEICQDCGTVIAEGTVVKKLTLSKPTVKVTGGKKKITVKYTKVTGANGFEVKYKVGKKTVTKVFNAKKNVTKTIKKLAKGTYKVQVRAFVKQGTKKAYSKWTKATKVKVK